MFYNNDNKTFIHSAFRIRNLKQNSTKTELRVDDRIFAWGENFMSIVLANTRVKFKEKKSTNEAKFTATIPTIGTMIYNDQENIIQNVHPRAQENHTTVIRLLLANCLFLVKSYQSYLLVCKEENFDPQTNLTDVLIMDTLEKNRAIAKIMRFLQTLHSLVAGKKLCSIFE